MADVHVGEVAAVLAVGLVVAGCTNADEPVVRDVASSFAAADPQGRCDLLTGGTLSSVEQEGPCPEAIGQLPVGSGDVESVDVWGADALVHLTDDTLFLTRGDAGWRISAAACRPAGPDRPYQCRLEAG